MTELLLVGVALLCLTALVLLVVAVVRDRPPPGVTRLSAELEDKLRAEVAYAMRAEVSPNTLILGLTRSECEEVLRSCSDETHRSKS